MSWSGEKDQRPGTDKHGKGDSGGGGDWKGEKDLRPGTDKRGGAKG